MAHDSLAQLAEHLTFNQGVRSSNLRWVTKNRYSFEWRFFLVFKTDATTAQPSKYCVISNSYNFEMCRFFY